MSFEPKSRRLVGGRALRRRAGFSILELAVVLTLLTVAAAIAIPLFFGRPSVTLDSAAILLARDLRAAQNEAVLRGRDVVVQFLPEGDGYRAFDESGELLPSPSGGGEFLRRYSRDGVFEGVRIELLDVAQNRSVHFTPEGFALQGLRLELVYAGDRRQLRLESATGLVSIEGLRRPWNDDGR